MRFEEQNDEVRLYFTHTSGRNFVLVEKLDGRTVEQAKTKLMQRMGEMNGVDTSTKQTES